IKKVFTFGKDKPAETSAVEAELEHRSPNEVLPVADDPFLPEEMDMAGGPAADIGEGGVEAPIILEEAVPLPPADQMSDFGLVPLS
ncbi:signal recognition particle-docking protein FtsY, partial [Rhizobium ruizarguesonis]